MLAPFGSDRWFVSDVAVDEHSDVIGDDPVGGECFGIPPDRAWTCRIAHKGERAYADAMGCDWMTSKEARQAVPPAYSEWIGARLLTTLADAA